MLRRELQTVARSVSQALQNETWGPTRSLRTDAWDTYQLALETALKPEEWIIVASAIEYIRNQTEPMIEIFAPAWETEVVQLPPSFVEGLRPLWDDCRQAYLMLYCASKAPPAYRDLGTLDAQLGGPRRVPEGAPQSPA